jgi:hypothetical protein
MTEPEHKRVSSVQVRAARFEDAEELARMRLALQQHMQASNPRLLAMSRQAIANLPKQYRIGGRLILKPLSQNLFIVLVVWGTDFLDRAH